MNSKEIIEKFGGQTALAKMIGKGQSTVAYWVKTGIIPARWQAQLLGLAISDGIKLSARDFVNESDSNQSQTREPAMGPVTTQLSGPDQIFTGLGESSPFMFYTGSNGTVKVQVVVDGETVWASQKGMSEIFEVDVTTINYHLKGIYQTGELDKQSTIGKFPIVQTEGERQVRRENIEFYSLDVIISVGYRVNSLNATQFRKWATSVLKSYLTKGFVLDDDRLKQGNQLFGKDYFDELLEKIRQIRASERRFYQRVTDLYAQCSVDYDKDSPITQQFYAHVQDKLHFAVHGHTSAELIELRADASKPNMGLNTWKNAGKGGNITKLDVTVGKNYLTPSEIDELERLVSMYLDWAELLTRRQKLLTMKDWISRLDGFLEFNAYSVLQNYGKVSRQLAERHAYSEYDKFRVVQDMEYRSDFDKVVDAARMRKLPKAGSN